MIGIIIIKCIYKYINNYSKENFHTHEQKNKKHKQYYENYVYIICNMF